MSLFIDSPHTTEEDAKTTAYRVRRYLERVAKNELIGVIGTSKRGKARWIVRVEAHLVERFPGVADILTEM